MISSVLLGCELRSCDSRLPTSCQPSLSLSAEVFSLYSGNDEEMETYLLTYLYFSLTRFLVYYKRLQLRNSQTEEI